MGSDVDRQIERSAELIRRMSRRQIGKRARSAGRRAKRAATYASISVAAILLVTLCWGIVAPIGLGGVLAAMLAMGIAVILSVLLSGERIVATRNLGRIDLKALPQATERWLEAQRASLPAAAMPLLDRLGERLDMMVPQLQSLNPDAPAAREVQALLSDHLPNLITGYQSIPRDLRRVERNGRLPDRQLIESLTLIEREIGDMTEELARGDLDSLSAHGRYLEMKYRDEPEIGGT